MTGGDGDGIATLSQAACCHRVVDEHEDDTVVEEDNIEREELGALEDVVGSQSKLTQELHEYFPQSNSQDTLPYKLYSTGGIPDPCDTSKTVKQTRLDNNTVISEEYGKRKGSNRHTSPSKVLTPQKSNRSADELPLLSLRQRSEANSLTTCRIQKFVFQGIISAAQSLAEREEGKNEVQELIQTSSSGCDTDATTPLLLCHESIEHSARSDDSKIMQPNLGDEPEEYPLPVKSEKQTESALLESNKRGSLVRQQSSSNQIVVEKGQHRTSLFQADTPMVDVIGEETEQPQSNELSKQRKRKRSAEHKAAATAANGKMGSATTHQDTFGDETAMSIAARASAIIKNDADLFKKVLLAMALSRQNPREKRTDPPPGSVIPDGFLWGNFPHLENVLRTHMKEYYDMSTNSRQSKTQQEFNNRLVRVIRKEACSMGWKFDPEAFATYSCGSESTGTLKSDRKIRDRIRCFFKTHIQNAKKRLLTMIRNPTKKANARALQEHNALIFAKVEGGAAGIAGCEASAPISSKMRAVKTKEAALNLEEDFRYGGNDVELSDAHDAAHQVLALGFCRLSQDSQL